MARALSSLSVLLLGSLAACAHGPGLAEADAAAEVAGLRRIDLPAGELTLTARLRDLDPSAPLHVYIEGDGRAWRTRHQPARHPVPAHPVALALAAKDPHPAVLWVARPCQLRPEPELARCDPALWTGARWGERALAAITEALESVRRARANHHVGLIGHSGGGVIATLLAERADDVDWLVTVASPLDPVRWTQHHAVTPMRESLDPGSDLGNLARLPQLHLYGASDPIVPANLVDGFISRLPGSREARLEVVPEADHLCCWERLWPARLDRFLERLPPPVQASRGDLD